VEAEEAEA
jgi:hypothetical protein